MALSQCNTFLILLATIQFILITKLISLHYHPISTVSTIQTKLSNSMVTSNRVSYQTTPTIINMVNIVPNISKPLDGVAVTAMLHSPKWYQRRYTLMIQNTINNLPDNWKIQIFYTAKGQSQAGLDISPGINRFIRKGDVVLTLLPKKMEKIKRYQLMFQPWFWSNMLADKVLLFGGGSVICSNSPYSIDNFIKYDYIGAPWSSYGGKGGDGGISLRNRNHMIQAITYALEKSPDTENEKNKENKENKENAYMSWGQEDHFYVSTLLEMNKLKRINSLIASKDETYKFAAIGSYANETVLIASGTLPELDYIARDKFLQYCPELKMVYPSLHDPNCFGASPNGEECAKSVCALRSRENRKGGC